MEKYNHQSIHKINPSQSESIRVELKHFLPASRGWDSASGSLPAPGTLQLDPSGHKPSQMEWNIESPMLNQRSYPPIQWHSWWDNPARWWSNGIRRIATGRIRATGTRGASLASAPMLFFRTRWLFPFSSTEAPRGGASSCRAQASSSSTITGSWQLFTFILTFLFHSMLLLVPFIPLSPLSLRLLRLLRLLPFQKAVEIL